MQLDIKGVKLHYEQYGSGARHVLMLHGWGCEIKHFAPIAEAMQTDYHITVIDFPAHGQSSPPPAPWGVGDFAACVRELMERLDILPCDIIAHSFGGRVALYLAANEPRLVKHLVLTGGAGLKKTPTAAQQKRTAQYQRLKKLYQVLSSVKLLHAWSEKKLSALRKKYGSADYNALDDEMKKTFVKVISEDLSPLLPRIEAPTLLIWGENDQDTPLWMGQKMEKDIPDAGLVVFEGDDHFAYLRQWPRFVRIVSAFLK